MLVLIDARALLPTSPLTGTAVAYHYSDGEVSGEEGSESLQLESDDDAATAAAAAAAMVAARERRLAATAAGRPAPAEAGGNKPRQQEQPRDPRRQHRLGVVEFLQGAEQPAVGDGGRGAADLSRFDSDSDAEWVGPPAAARRQPAAQGQAAQLAKRQRQQQAAQAQQPPAKQPRQQEPEALPSGSSGSSGGSELEEWLAGGHVGSPASSGSGGTSGSEGGEDGGEEQSDGAAEWASSGGAEDASEQEASSGGSELEEWLAHAGEGGTSSADEEGERPGRAAAGSGQGSPAGMRRPERQAGGQQQPQQLPQQQQAPQPPQQQQAPQQARHQQRGVVDFLEGGEATGRQWWQKPPPAIDLDRFASSSEDEGAAPGAPQQAAPHGTKRRRQERTIPQVDGAADTDSDSEEETSSSDGEGSSEDGSGGSSSGEGEEESGDSGSEEDEGASAGSSSSEEEDSESSDGEGEPAAAASTPAKQQAAGGKAQGRNSSGSSSEDEDEDAADGAAAAAAAAAAAEEQRQLAALAALFPEGAAFQRNEPLPQLEATWRASREGWAQVRCAGWAGGADAGNWAAWGNEVGQTKCFADAANMYQLRSCCPDPVVAGLPAEAPAGRAVAWPRQRRRRRQAPAQGLRRPLSAAGSLCSTSVCARCGS